MSDTEFKMAGIVSSDPGAHVKKIRMLEKLGPTAMVLMDMSGTTPTAR